MAKFVSYFDCSGWESSIEVMNAQKDEKKFNLSAYAQDGKELLSQDHTISGRGTIRIKLNDHLRGHQGQVVIKHVENADDAFPAIMTLCADGEDYKLGNRFFPFTRV